MNTKKRHNTMALITIAASVVLTLALIEAGLRIAGWERFFETVEKVREGEPRRLVKRTLHAGAEIRHTTREFDVTYFSNSMGYYDREWSMEKEPGAVRIGFFGDSFTMGHGIGSDGAFPRLAGPLLSEKSGIAVETLNFGIWGSGTLDEREYIEDSAALDLDHVVICFYINDIFDNGRYIAEKGDPASSGKEAAAAGTGGLTIGLKDFLNRHSRVFAFTMERSKNLRDALGLVTYPLENVFTGKENGLIEDAAGHLRDIYALLEVKNIRMTVVYIPSRVQVCDVKMPEEFDLDLPNTILGENLGGIGYIDLTGPMRTGDADSFWFREGHFNEQGHVLVARSIADRLKIVRRPTVNPPSGSE